jgi:hypothetical protein
MADKQPSQSDIVKAQVQDYLGTANQMFGSGRLDYRAFQNTQNLFGSSSPQDVIRQDFGTLQQQSKEAVPQGLTSQEQNLYQHHLNNLTHGGYVQQQGGGISTIRNITIEQDGRTYVIPTVWNGREVSPQLATQFAKQKGLNQFPSYSSREEAEARYNQLHSMMDRDVDPLQRILSYLRARGMM